MRRSRLDPLLGLLLILSTASIGCVDQEMSLNLRGVFNYEGQLEESEVECGSGNGGGEPRTVTEPVVTCETEVSTGGVETFLSRAKVNIQTLESRGQVGSEFEPLSQIDICEVDEATYIDAKYRQPSFRAVLSAVNRLSDSRQVGAQGGGGGTGGFEDLKLDANTVQLKKLQVRFPDAPAGVLEKTIRLGRMVESEGGAVVEEFVLFRDEEIAPDVGEPGLKEIHRRLVLGRTGLDAYDARARATTVRMRARIWLEGETLGGREVESNRLSLPIDVCNAEGACSLTQECDLEESAGG